MTTAGLYETSGDWLGAFSPRLDGAGNSVKGRLAARFLSGQLGLDLFASRPEQ